MVLEMNKMNHPHFHALEIHQLPLLPLLLLLELNLLQH